MDPQQRPHIFKVCAMIVQSVNTVEWKLLQLQITQRGILLDF